MWECMQCVVDTVTDDGTCRGADWLPLTFDLVLELPQFARAFQQREYRYVVYQFIYI